MTFTKEHLIARAETVLSNARTAADFHDSKPYHLMDVHLAEIALASLKAEPVITVGDDGGDALAYRRLIQTFAAGTKLYTAPPAPASVPDEVAAEDCPAFVGYDVTEVDEAWARGFNACRAAMLQGAAGNCPVIPDWQAKAEKMAELHGSSFVLFRNGESPQCADPTKVIISFTDEGLGHGSAAPQQEAGNG